MPISKTGIFTKMMNADPQKPFLDPIPVGEMECIDNPDGRFTAEDPLSLGPYAAAMGGRDFSQGAGTAKGTGAASGHGRIMRVRGGGSR